MSRGLSGLGGKKKKNAGPARAASLYVLDDNDVGPRRGPPASKGRRGPSELQRGSEGLLRVPKGGSKRPGPVAWAPRRFLPWDRLDFT